MSATVILALEEALVFIKVFTTIVVATHNSGRHSCFPQLEPCFPNPYINSAISSVPAFNDIFTNLSKYNVMPRQVVNVSALPQAQTVSANTFASSVSSADGAQPSTKSLTVAKSVASVGDTEASTATSSGPKDKPNPILYLNALKTSISIPDKADIEHSKPVVKMNTRVSAQTYNARSLLASQNSADHKMLFDASEKYSVNYNYQLLKEDRDLRIEYLNAVSDFCHTLMQTNNEIDYEKRAVARLNLLSHIPLFDQACTQLIGPAHYEIQDAIANIRECYFDTNGNLKTMEVVAGATDKIAIALRRIYINEPIQNLVSLTKDKEYIFKHKIIPATDHPKFKDVFFAERDAGFYKMLEVGQRECHSYGFSKFDLNDSSNEKIEYIKNAANPKEKRASGVFRSNPGPVIAAINSEYNEKLRSLVQFCRAGKYDEACEIVNKISNQSVMRIAADIRKHYFSDEYYTCGIYIKGVNDPLWKTISSEVKQTIQENRTLRNHMNEILAMRYNIKSELERLYYLPAVHITGVDELLYDLVSLPNDPNIHIDFLLDKAKNKVSGWHVFFNSNHVLRTLNFEFGIYNSNSTLIQNFKLNRNLLTETQIEIIRYFNKFIALNVSDELFLNKVEKSLEYLVVANNSALNSKESQIYLNLAKEMYDSLSDSQSVAAKVLGNHDLFDVSNPAAIERNLPEIEKLLSKIEQEIINGLLEAIEDVNLDLSQNREFADLFQDSFKDLINLRNRKSLTSKGSGFNNLDQNGSGGPEGPNSEKTKRAMVAAAIAEAYRKNKKKAKEALRSFKNKVVEKLNPFGVYENAPYHTRVGNSIKSKAPINGQASLDKSILVKSKGNTRYQRRITIENNEFVVLDEHMKGKFHGHVRTWDDLGKPLQEFLKKLGLVTNNGKIK